MNCFEVIFLAATNEDMYRYMVTTLFDQTIVELQYVSVQYPTGIIALEGITFEAFDKDLIGLIGPNGSGKSTLLRVILGLIKPNAGTLRLFGEPVSPKTLRQVGYVATSNAIIRIKPARCSVPKLDWR